MFSFLFSINGTCKECIPGAGIVPPKTESHPSFSAFHQAQEFLMMQMLNLKVLYQKE